MGKTRHTDIDAVIATWREVMAGAPDRLRALDPAATAERIDPAAWSPRERLGHCIDGAANQHQFLARALTEELISLQLYDPGAAVEAQRYRERDWHALVDLWEAMNRHLLHVAGGAGEAQWQTMCLIGHDKPKTLARVTEDYVRHLRRHLEKLLPERERTES